MPNETNSVTHVDDGDPGWRALWGVALAMARRSGRILSVLATLRVPSYDKAIVTLALVGHTSQKPRPVRVAMIEVSGRRYVGNPNGLTPWLTNLAAMETVTLTIARQPPRAVRPVGLRLGPERDAVIRATAHCGPIHIRPMYRLSRGHVLRAGVFYRLDPIPA